MKRSILSLIYLIQGMRKAGIEIDQKLKNIGLRVDALDPSFIIRPRLEGNILNIIGQNIASEKGLVNELALCVQDYLELQQGIMPSMLETAQALHMPKRTLRHQLQQLQSSYKQIREQLMKDKALKLIEYQEYSIEMIAALLGYSESAAFNHAFKTWFGHGPRQYFK